MMTTDIPAYKAMIKTYLQHQLERAVRGEITNALQHCHIKDLHSIMFHDADGNRMRMFYADPNHELWRNDFRKSERSQFSLAIHPHHSDLRFVNIFGNAHNDRYQVVVDPQGTMQEMAYTSAIITGTTGSLTPTGRKGVAVRTHREHMSTNPAMRAHEHHSIYVPLGESAAWLVMEGATDPAYKSTCWTNNAAPQLVGLYKPMPQWMVVDRIQSCINKL